MLGPRDPVTRFFLAVLLWLPLLFFLWYYMAILLSMPLHWMANITVDWLLPEAITEIQQSGYLLDYITQIQRQETLPGSTRAQYGEVVISINPLIYGYGLPLFTALVLASPDRDMDDKWPRWILGMLILLPVQLFGITMEALKILSLGLGMETTRALGFATWQLEGIALGYQLGYLILPAMTPIALWIGMYRNWVGQIAPGFMRHFEQQ